MCLTTSIRNLTHKELVQAAQQTLSLKGDYDRVSAGAQEGQDAGPELCLALCCPVAFT